MSGGELGVDAVENDQVLHWKYSWTVQYGFLKVTFSNQKNKQRMEIKLFAFHKLTLSDPLYLTP